MIEIKDAPEEQKVSRPVLPEIKNPEVLRRAIRTYGTQEQADMAIEEMSELIKALLKYRRVCNDPEKRREARKGIVEEAADVLITVAQAIIIYDYDREIQGMVDYKLDRLRGRLEEARKEST